MFTIFEQGDGRGIGHGLQSFLNRFDAICVEHQKSGRARSFAFIFYDFTDNSVRRILKDHGVFTQLDRLSGDQLSVFYLHAETKATLDMFNQRFFHVLGLSEDTTLPCVTFFRVQDGSVIDIEVAQLENANLIHGFHELYEVIKQYLRRDIAAPEKPSQAIKWLRAGLEFLSVETFRAALKSGLEVYF